MQKRAYNLSRQENFYYCMPAIIQAILRRRGREETQETIAQRLKSTPEVGTLLESDLQDFLVERGLFISCARYNQIMFNMPERIVEEAFEDDSDLILGCLNSGGRGHFFLVTEYLAPNLKVLDPKDGQPYSLNLMQIYDKMWYDRFGNFCWVSPVSILQK